MDRKLRESTINQTLKSLENRTAIQRTQKVEGLRQFIRRKIKKVGF